MMAQFLGYGTAQSTCALSVDDTNFIDGIENAFVDKQTKLAECFINRLPTQIQLSFHIGIGT